jgi:hypothetical protein
LWGLIQSALFFSGLLIAMVIEWILTGNRNISTLAYAGFLIGTLAPAVFAPHYGLIACLTDFKQVIRENLGAQVIGDCG